MPPNNSFQVKKSQSGNFRIDDKQRTNKKAKKKTADPIKSSQRQKASPEHYIRDRPSQSQTHAQSKVDRPSQSSRHMYCQTGIGSTHAAREASQDACTVKTKKKRCGADPIHARAAHTQRQLPQQAQRQHKAETTTTDTDPLSELRHMHCQELDTCTVKGAATHAAREAPARSKQKKKMRCGPPSMHIQRQHPQHAQRQHITKPSPQSSHRQTQTQTTTSETETDPLRALDTCTDKGATHAAREASQDACTVETKTKKMRCGPRAAHAHSGSSHNKLRGSTKPRVLQQRPTHSQSLDTCTVKSYAHVLFKGATHAAREAPARSKQKKKRCGADPIHARAAHTHSGSSHNKLRGSTKPRVL
jgi:hypothetical protein